MISFCCQLRVLGGPLSVLTWVVQTLVGYAGSVIMPTSPGGRLIHVCKLAVTFGYRHERSSRAVAAGCSLYSVCVPGFHAAKPGEAPG